MAVVLMLHMFLAVTDSLGKCKLINWLTASTHANHYLTQFETFQKLDVVPNALASASSCWDKRSLASQQHAAAPLQKSQPVATPGCGRSTALPQSVLRNGSCLVIVALRQSRLHDDDTAFWQISHLANPARYQCWRSHSGLTATWSPGAASCRHVKTAVSGSSCASSYSGF
jgi:hypothetical protein